MLANAHRLTYDTRRYPFARVLESEVFRIRPLSQLHRFWRKQKAARYGQDVLGYTDNLILRRCMQRLQDDSPLYRLYHSFVSNELAPHYGRRIRVTAHPKMRVHLDGTPGVSAWHRDVDVTHRHDQINVFLPFTDCDGTNTLWCESDYGLGDYAPIPVRYGEALLFDGGFLRHGTVMNDSGATRVSMDFRFTPRSFEGVRPPWAGILAGRERHPVRY